MSIRVKCRTNLDDINCSGVVEMVAMPSKGQLVEVRTQGGSNFGYIDLEIVCLTHKSDSFGPYLLVELHNKNY